MCENKVPYLKGNRNLHAMHFVVDNIIRLHRFMTVCVSIHILKKNYGTAVLSYVKTPN